MLVSFLFNQNDILNVLNGSRKNERQKLFKQKNIKEEKEMAENTTDNARFIFSYFRGKGWTAQAICGMLGNMQGESGIIADKDEYGGGGGYGLVQWTPKSNLVNWANANGLNYRSVETQCKRIQWELDNGQQFYATGAYPINFRQFSQSTQSPTYLASAFINNYERPANANQPQRGVWAEEWYRTLNNGTIPPIGDGGKKVTKYFCGINVGTDFTQVQAYRVAINNQWKIDYLDIYYYQKDSNWFIGINNLNFTGDGGVEAYRMAFNNVFGIPFDKITYYSYEEQAWEIGYSGVSLTEYQNLRLRMMAKGLQLREVKIGTNPDRYDVLAINLSFRDIQRYRLQFMSEFADIIVGTRVTYKEM